MRIMRLALCLAFLVISMGCESTRWSWLKNDKQQNAPAVAGGNGVPTTVALVAYLNENSRRIENVRVADVDLTCTQGVQSFGLSGQLVAQKPRSFRMSAKALGNPEVDLGSNDQEFWYWVKRVQPPYQVFCTYKDLNEGRVRQMPIPFQPEWVMEAMGMGQYGPPEKYTLEHDARTLRLVEKTTSPQGVPIRKVIVMERQAVRAPRPQVTEFLLQEEKGKEICSARITEVQVDPSTGAIVPRRIELRYPAEKLKLAMKFDAMKINQSLPNTVFARQLMQGIPSFNLALMREDNSPPLQAFSDNSRVDPGLKAAQGFNP